ncbi:hypothetical protein SJ_176 [Proteus phage SJ_PmiM]|nr:hypothetical protein SJ_176 [Proteus phage SJ_PmiM]
MKELIPGLNIEPGYMIEISSWENDGDNYTKQYFYGLSEEEVKMFAYILPFFKSQCNNVGCFGNEDFDDVEKDILDRLYIGLQTNKLTMEFIQKYFTPSDLLNSLCLVLGTGVEYDYDFVRVFEGMHVYEIENPITTPPLRIVQ